MDLEEKEHLATGILTNRDDQESKPYEHFQIDNSSDLENNE